MSEHSQEGPHDLHNQAESSGEISELQVEHDGLAIEWKNLHEELIKAQEALRARVSQSTPENPDESVETLGTQIETIHNRQHEIIDRQWEIEQRMMALIRD